MAAQTSDGHVLLVKKLGGLFAIIIGCLLTAVGVTFESSARLSLAFSFWCLALVCSLLRSFGRTEDSPLH